MNSTAKTNSQLITGVLAFVIPLTLSLYWILWVQDQSLATLVLRPVILGVSVVLSWLLSYRLPVTRAEKELAVVMAVLCFVLLAPSLAASDPTRALRELVKLIIICAVSVASCRSLRHVPTARIFGASLIAASALTGGLMVEFYLQRLGWVLPTYEALRFFKGQTEVAGISLNGIAFDCLFAYVCGMCLVRNTKALWALGVGLIVISSALTGSRAPLATLGISGLVLLVINALRSRRLLVWVVGGFLAAAMLLGTIGVIGRSTATQLSEFTEGRWELWSVALQKFAERPLLGYGYQSVQDDSTFIPGGYHSEYLTALAEQGIIGTAAVLALFWFLVRHAWNLAFRPLHTWPNGQWALFGSLLLITRAAVEVDGLFGYAQGSGDFLAYIFVAIVVSRFSVEEDYISCREQEAWFLLQSASEVCSDAPELG